MSENSVKETFLCFYILKQATGIVDTVNYKRRKRQCDGILLLNIQQNSQYVKCRLKTRGSIFLYKFLLKLLPSVSLPFEGIKIGEILLNSLKSLLFHRISFVCFIEIAEIL